MDFFDIWEGIKYFVQESEYIFIDEAHQLVPDKGGGGYSMDVIKTLMNFITQVEKGDRLPTIIILAGYIEPINQLLLQDDGLNRRFPTTLRFMLEPYTPKELGEIFEMKYKHTIEVDDLENEFSNDNYKKWYRELLKSVSSNRSDVPREAFKLGDVFKWINKKYKDTWLFIQ